MRNFLTNIDTIIVVIYFGVLIYLGLTSSRKINNNVNQYFLAGRSFGWFIIGASLFATFVSMEQLLFLTGAGSQGEISLGRLEWLGGVFLILLGWLIAPKLLKANIISVPQYFGKKFDNRTRLFFAIVSLLGFSLMKIMISLIATGILLNNILGWDVFNTSIILILFSGIYTLIGGMHAVKNTHVLQALTILLSIIVLLGLGVTHLNDLNEIASGISFSNLTLEFSPNDMSLSAVVVMFAAPIFGIWYWCSDQYIIQRIVSSKNIHDVKKGTLIAAGLSILSLGALILVGSFTTQLFPSSSGSNVFTTLFNNNFINAGIKGLLLVGFFSALMSTISSSFISAATIFTFDIYAEIKKDISQIEYVLVGRLATISFIIITIAVFSIIKLLGNTSYTELQTLQAYIAPPIVSVFMIGLFWNDASKHGAIWALSIGYFVGLLKIIATIIDVSVLNKMAIFEYFIAIDEFTFAVLLFVISSLVFIIISKLYANEQSDSQFENVTEGKIINKLGFSVATNKFENSHINREKTNSEVNH